MNLSALHWVPGGNFATVTGAEVLVTDSVPHGEEEAGMAEVVAAGTWRSDCFVLLSSGFMVVPSSIFGAGMYR